LIYTPENEHFGIVPLEAMLAGIPVLATNTGGPLETIYDGRIGWLRSPEKITQ
jgi:alpha-1,3/alpha-1,6-mannosyltransferase